MKEKNKPVYYCEHCGKHGLRKHSMLRHELMCFKNPENIRPCKKCIHLTMKTTNTIISSVDVLTDEFEKNDYEVTLYFCKFKNVFLYTPQIEIKGSQYQLEEQNLPMPKECESFELIKYDVIDF